MNDITVVYYTAHRERPEFEQGIMLALQESCCGAPIISVSQQPLKFGKNICLGEIGVNEMNAITQALTGVRAAETKYVALAESDCLFPKSMFAVQPEGDVWHYPDTAYIIWEGHARFWPKAMRELVGVTTKANAERVLSSILQEKPKYVSKSVLRLTKQATFDSSQQPAITIKTDRQMHRRSPHGREAVEVLPHWGTADELWRRLQ